MKRLCVVINHNTIQTMKKIQLLNVIKLGFTMKTQLHRRTFFTSLRYFCFLKCPAFHHFLFKKTEKSQYII